MNIYMDSEFTGLHKDTTLISIGLVSEDGRTFYAEFNDYDGSQVDDWIKANVIDNLLYSPPPPDQQEHYARSRFNPDIPLTHQWNLRMRGNKAEITKELTKWFSQFDDHTDFELPSVTIWSDCLAYDWVLFCDLFGGAMNLPKYINYIPLDLSTFFYLSGVDPDCNREKFAGMTEMAEMTKHNSLWDAMVIRNCVLRLLKLKALDTFKEGI